MKGIYRTLRFCISVSSKTEVHCGQRQASMANFRSAHRTDLGGLWLLPASFSKAASLAEAVLIALTITNTTNAMIRKLMIAVRNLP